MFRRLLRGRFLLPGAVLVAVGLGGTFGIAASASGATGPSSTTSTTTVELNAQNGQILSTTTTTAPTSTTTGTTQATTATSPTAAATATVHAKTGLGSTRSPGRGKAAKSALSCRKEVNQISYPGGGNAGSPKGSTKLHCVDGRVVSYGNSAITYKAVPRSYIKPGEALYSQYCSSCHEANAEGGTAAPNLVGLGPATVDFWVRTGRMPAKTPLTVQADSKPPELSKLQAKQIAAYITSLSPSAPFIPQVNVKGANLAQGASLFALNCAACHTITGAGDALAQGTYAPTLHHATSTVVASAIRTGPGNMPRFAGNLSDNQVRDIVAYVTEKIQHPSNPGGFGLGGIGPVAEGFVALLFGVGGFMLICFWIGDRAR